MLNDLEGMFAFALFDARRGELFLAGIASGKNPFTGLASPMADSRLLPR